MVEHPHCPPCNQVHMLHCAWPEYCGNVIGFGDCKTCGSPLIMVKVRELNGQIVAACTACDIVKSQSDATSDQST